MFIITVNYVKPLADVDRVLDDHRKFLARHYASGHFLPSGPKEPRTGGMIRASSGSKSEIENIIQQDPFFIARIAEYEVVEFLPTMAAEKFAEFKNR